MNTFDDFLATITEDDFVRIANIVNECSLELHKDNKDNNLYLGDQMSITSFIWARELLRLYDKWSRTVS